MLLLLLLFFNSRVTPFTAPRTKAHNIHPNPPEAALTYIDPRPLPSWGICRASNESEHLPRSYNCPLYLHKGVLVTIKHTKNNVLQTQTPLETTVKHVPICKCPRIVPQGISEKAGTLKASCQSLQGPIPSGPSLCVKPNYPASLLSHVAPATPPTFLFLTRVKHTHASGYLSFLLPGQLFNQTSVWQATSLHSGIGSNVNSLEMKERYVIRSRIRTKKEGLREPFLNHNS